MAERQKIENLVKQYFNVCNDALARQRNAAPFREIITLINRIIDNEKYILLKVIDNQGAILAIFTIRFIVDRFELFETKAQHPDRQFVISKHHLEEVVDNANYYMKHPLKLDWDWLKTYLSS